jgi:hypothetical protein
MKKYNMYTVLMVIAAAIVLGYTTAAFAGEPLKTESKPTDWKVVESRLIEAFHSDNDGVRVSAASLLGKYRLAGACTELIESLKTDKCDCVRMASALALVSIGDQCGLKAVQDIADSDADINVSSFCRGLLQATNLHTAVAG